MPLLALKVFGSVHIETHYKMCFLKSLIMSRQNSNAHIAVLQPKQLKRMNAIYMRVLRRISGQMLFEANPAKLNDLQVRELMDAPSVDCILLAARLRYAARLVKHCPPTPVAVLHFQSKGKQLPWTKLLCDDMRSLQVRGLDCPGGDPIDAADSCHAWLASDHAHKVTQQVHFVGSILDALKTPDACTSPTRERSFVCTLCEPKFASQKALDMHSRIKHGTRSPVNVRISGSVCPACCKDFHARERCLNHRSDARRHLCRTWVIANVAPLTPDVVKNLNLKDRSIGRQAHKQGHTSVLSLRPPSVVVQQ
jgi:hypothetical protein